MKIVSIGDIHGRTNWKEALKIEADLYVFIGDYVDSFNISDDQILENLLEIIYLKLDEPDKYILLLGNHDIQYIYDGYQCSGYRSSMQRQLNILFTEYLYLFQIAYQHDNYLWTHAGISKKWWIKLKEIFIADDKNLESMIATTLNVMVFSFGDKQYLKEIFSCGPSSGGDRYDISGPLWARPDDIRATYPFEDNIHQIVGHTAGRTIETFTKFQDKTYDNASITYIDCLDKLERFYTITI